MAGRRPVLEPKRAVQGIATLAVVTAVKRSRGPIKKAVGIVPTQAFVQRAEYVRWLRGESIRRGVLGGSPAWIAAAGVLWGARAVRVSQRRQEQILLKELLAPGERVVVSEVRRKEAKGVATGIERRPRRRKRR